MSQYMHFFIRSKDDKFYPINTFSRCSSVYRIFSEGMHVPYKYIKAVSTANLQSIKDTIHEHETNIQDNIDKLQTRIAAIASFNNSAEEKLEAIAECQEAIASYCEDKTEIVAAKGLLYLISDMIDEAYDTKYCDGEYKNWLDSDHYVYIGIECYHPTVEDIKGED